MGTLLISKIRESTSTAHVDHLIPSPKVSDTVVEPTTRRSRCTSSSRTRTSASRSTTALYYGPFARSSSRRRRTATSTTSRAAVCGTTPAPLPGPAQLRPASSRSTWSCSASLPFMVGFAPLTRGSAVPRAHGAGAHAAQFDAKNMMCAADPRHGRYLTCSCLFRGRMSTKEVDGRCSTSSTRTRRTSSVDPEQRQVGHLRHPPKGLKMATFIGNTAVHIVEARRRAVHGHVLPQGVPAGTRARAWTRWSSPRPSPT